MQHIMFSEEQVKPHKMGVGVTRLGLTWQPSGRLHPVVVVE